MRIDKVCELCGKAFAAEGRNCTRRRFCSAECMKAWWKAETARQRRKTPPLGESETRPCAICGKSFTPPQRQPFTKYCSEGCVGQAKAQRVQDYAEQGKQARQDKIAGLRCTCAFCGELFTPTRRPNLNRRTYCSPECRDKHAGKLAAERHRPKSPPQPRLCQVCGKKFTPSVRHPNAVTCSQPCNAKRQRIRAKTLRGYLDEKRAREAACACCGKSFLTTSGVAKYCSDECRMMVRAEGECNRLPPELKTLRNRKSRWKGKWLQAMERDGHKCRLCDAAEKLCEHHLDGVGEKKSGQYAHNHDPSLDNLWTLCDRCHKGFHNINLLLKDGKWTMDGVIFAKLGLAVEVKLM